MYYGKFLNNLPLVIPFEDSDSYHVYHLYVIQTKKRDELRSTLKAQGIETGIHYPIPLHLQKAYKYLSYSKGDFPVTERCADSILSLPMYPELSEIQQHKIIKEIKKVILKSETIAGGVVS